jgi:hypothetical protein
MRAVWRGTELETKRATRRGIKPFKHMLKDNKTTCQFCQLTLTKLPPKPTPPAASDNIADNRV